MANSTVSVAIATYKRRDMVQQAIHAALRQTLAPLEVVVTDDASPDDTWAMLSTMSGEDSRVRIFRREENSGGVDNWNFAIEQTQGDYIAWCSDDDRFLPDHLQVSVRYLDDHPQVGLVHSGFIDALEAEGTCRLEPRRLRFPTATQLDRDSLLGYVTRYYDWPFHPSTIVMRRAVWEQVGTFDRRWALADTDWFIRVVECFPVVLLSRYGVKNRRHAGNWSNRVGSARMQAEIFQIVENSIGRLTEGRPLQRMAWRAIWRANVRLRLLLTLRRRLQSGHGDAAAASWEALLLETGRRGPQWMVTKGAGLLRRWSNGREGRFKSARESVSPL